MRTYPTEDILKSRDVASTKVTKNQEKKKSLMPERLTPICLVFGGVVAWRCQADTHAPLKFLEFVHMN